MTLSGKTMLQLDRCFRIPHRLMERLWNSAGHLHGRNQDQSIVIKFMGMGSLIQFASLCEDHAVDKNKITLLTLARHREICRLIGFEKVWMIRTHNLIFFFMDCWTVLRAAHSLRPTCVIDFERCSHAAGLFRILLAWLGQCSSISFELGRTVTSPQQIVYPVNELNQEELFLKGIDQLPKKKQVIQYENIDINPIKIIININASNYLLARRYPSDSFAILIKSLHQSNRQFEFFLTGTLDESSYVAELIKKLPGIPAYNVAGKWDLKTFTQGLMTCGLFISGDSGPLHLAVYLLTPTIAIWGPTQPGHFGYQSKANLSHLSLNLPCAPCLTHPDSHPAKACLGKIVCMKNLAATSIVEKSLSILSIQPMSRLVRPPAAMNVLAEMEVKSLLA